METEIRKGLGLGFAGAHRTGKSTLVEALADDYPDYPVIKSATVNIAEQLGFKVGPDMKPEQRVEFQEAVLTAFEVEWIKAHGVFLCDRTPLDFAAYALADVTKDTGAAFRAWVDSYVARCLKACEDYFAGIVVVQPGIPFVAAEGKAPPDTHYQELHAAWVLSLAERLPEDLVTIMPRPITDLDERLDYASCSLFASLEVVTAEMAEEFPHVSLLN